MCCLQGSFNVDSHLLVHVWIITYVFAVLSALDNPFLGCMFDGIEVKVLSIEG